MALVIGLERLRLEVRKRGVGDDCGVSGAFLGGGGMRCWDGGV